MLKKKSTQMELLAYVKTAKYRFKTVPVLHGEQQQQKKKMMKELEIGTSFINFTDHHLCR